MPTIPDQSLFKFIEASKSIVTTAITQLQTQIGSSVTFQASYQTNLEGIKSEIKSDKIPLVIVFLGQSDFPQGVKKPRRSTKLYCLCIERAPLQNTSNPAAADLADSVSLYLDTFITNELKYQIERYVPFDLGDRYSAFLLTFNVQDF